jgi:hypothetical protein
MPIRATMATRAMMIGVLFFNGEVASGCWGTVAG